MVRVLAPAKLTVSLRVTGVRPDGYHELDAEMVTLDLADELVLREGGPALAVVGGGPACGRAGCRAPARTSWSGRWRPVAARADVRSIKRIPIGGGLGGGSADAAAVLRWAGCADLGVALRLGSDVPFCLVGGRARVHGVGERVVPAALRGPGLPPPPAALRRGHGQRLPGLGRGAPATTAARTRSRTRPWPSSPAWRAGATPCGSWPGPSPRWPGAAPPGSSRARRRRRDELRVGARDGPAGARPHGAGGLGGGLRGDRDRAAGATCRPGAASGWPSASSCASSCASACGAS